MDTDMDISIGPEGDSRLAPLRRLLRLNRSVRRFDNARRIGAGTLRSLVDLARFCASSQNVQPLRYMLLTSPEECARLFPALLWARHLKDWPGPAPAERPVAYIVQTTDTDLFPSPLCDCGLELEAITLGATALGIGGCIIRNFNPKEVGAILGLPDRYKVEYVLALGYPAETVMLEEPGDGPGVDYNYRRDADDRHIVPKRSLRARLLPSPDDR